MEKGWYPVEPEYFFKMKKKKVALVLSSGGARGYAHIGVIHELEKNGFEITSIAGTSMGALVGGIYATGQLTTFEEWVKALNIREILKLTDFSISNKGLVKGARVIKKLKELIPDRKIEELAIPYCAVATDIVTGAEKVFTEGSLYEAIRASISIPTFFQPFKLKGQFLVDGGLVNPIPINRIKKDADNLLVVVDVNALIPVEKKESVQPPPPSRDHSKQVAKLLEKLHTTIPHNQEDHFGIMNLSTKSIGLMLQTISALTLEKYQPDLLIRISREAFSTFDFYKAEEIIREGESVAQRAIHSISGSIIKP